MCAWSHDAVFPDEAGLDELDFGQAEACRPAAAVAN